MALSLLPEEPPSPLKRPPFPPDPNGGTGNGSLRAAAAVAAAAAAESPPWLASEDENGVEVDPLSLGTLFFPPSEFMSAEPLSYKIKIKDEYNTYIISNFNPPI